jgi:hypothetical protein
MMVNIGHKWEVFAVLIMTEITVFVKFITTQIIWTMLHANIDKIGIQDPILEIF